MMIFVAVITSAIVLIHYVLDFQLVVASPKPHIYPALPRLSKELPLTNAYVYTMFD